MMLQRAGVHAHYGHIHALKGIDVDVQVGEISSRSLKTSRTARCSASTASSAPSP